MSAAETLRRAAALMRERAEVATPDVCPEWTYNAVRHIARNCSIECAYSHEQGDALPVPHDSDGDSAATWDRYNDAAHIASWHPAVALAVADWLDDAALVAETHSPPYVTRALAVARAYLGESA